MIKINLALQKRSSITADGKSGKSLLSNSQLEQLKELPIRRIAIPLVLAYVVSFGLDSIKEDKLADLDKLITKQKAEATKLESSLAKVKTYDALKKSLDADELAIKTKLDIIKKLMANRGFISKSLLSISSAAPKEVWLTGFKCDINSVTLQGSSLGFNQISDFMKNLNDTHLFSSIELVNSQQSKDIADGASFELTAKRK
jgi:hypothetical protein